MSSQQDIAN
jgi:hypothetical protein